MRSQRAATLVELMIVLSIIGTVASILTPAVQKARESSRANSCRNNMRQTGVALLQYESAHGHFPIGAKGRYDLKVAPGPMYGLCWWADTIGLMGETAVADQLDRKGANIGWAALNSRNGKVANGFAPDFFFCPSSPVPRFVRVSAFDIAAPSYTGISGATNDDGFNEKRVNRCCRVEGQISAGGVLIPNVAVRIRSITDGTSKTVMVGEQSDYADNGKLQLLAVGSSFLKGWLAGSLSTATPPDYTDWAAPSHNLATVRYRLNEHCWDLPGIYLDGGVNNPLLSPHMGVVNLLNCDGSVHAAADSMAVAVLKSLVTRDNDEGINE